MRILIMIKPDHDAVAVMGHVQKCGVHDVRQIGKLHILLANMDGRKMRRIAAIPGVSSVAPDREIKLAPPGQPQ